VAAPIGNKLKMVIGMTFSKSECLCSWSFLDFLLT
jgi:hypothetical protein